MVAPARKLPAVIPNAIAVVSQEIVWVSIAGGAMRCITSIAVTVAGAIATPASGSRAARVSRPLAASRGTPRRATERPPARREQRDTDNQPAVQRHMVPQRAVAKPSHQAGHAPQPEQQA